MLAAIITSDPGLSLTDILLTTLAGGGLLGAVVALLKLRPDANSAAVAQSQGAMETMATLNRQLVTERDQWRERALKCERAADDAQHKLEDAQSQLGRLKPPGGLP